MIDTSIIADILHILLLASKVYLLKTHHLKIASYQIPIVVIPTIIAESKIHAYLLMFSIQKTV